MLYDGGNDYVNASFIEVWPRLSSLMFHFDYLRLEG